MTDSIIYLSIQFQGNSAEKSEKMDCGIRSVWLRQYQGFPCGPDVQWNLIILRPKCTRTWFSDRKSTISGI